MITVTTEVISYSFVSEKKYFENVCYIIKVSNNNIELRTKCIGNCDNYTVSNLFKWIKGIGIGPFLVAKYIIHKKNCHKL